MLRSLSVAEAHGQPWWRADSLSGGTLAVAPRNGESRWQDRLETLLWDQRAQTLGVFSRIAEECGYFTRLITLGPSALPSAELPAVIEDDDRSIAVIFEATGQSVTVGNPARQRLSAGPRHMVP